MSFRAALHLPKEHGAWGMFFIPVALGLIAAGGLPWEAVLFLFAATAVFLSREPLMAAWRCWRRGQSTGWAGSAFAVYAGIALLAGAPLALERPWLIAIGAAGAAVVLWHAGRGMRGKGRSLAAELLAIAASVLSGPAAYYAASGHFAAGIVLWVLSLAYFWSSVFYVKMRLQQAHAPGSAAAEGARRNCAVYHAVLAAVLLVAGVSGSLEAWCAVAFLPVIVRALVRVVRPAAELNLRRVGWTEVLYSAVFVVLAGWGLQAQFLRSMTVSGS